MRYESLHTDKEHFTGKDLALRAIEGAIERVRQAKGDHSSARLSRELKGYRKVQEGCELVGSHSTRMATVYRVWARQGEEEFEVLDIGGGRFVAEVSTESSRHEDALPSQRLMKYRIK
jgi:hypothetical protein